VNTDPDLILRIGDLRRQRDEARAERDALREHIERVVYALERWNAAPDESLVVASVVSHLRTALEAK